ncbi:MAG: endolytic transglycosylase MltG [Clostridia bacterium]|nr:endolytic transglycosylase MltG [Clostridia bacterium]
MDERKKSNDAYDELLKSFSSFKQRSMKNQPEQQNDEDDVKNNGEIYFSANSETAKQESHSTDYSVNTAPERKQHILIPEEKKEVEAVVSHKRVNEAVKNQSAKPSQKKTGASSVKKKKSKKKKNSTATSIMLVALIVVFVVAASFVLRIPLMGVVNDVIAINGDDTEIRVIIDEGMDYDDIIDLFAQKNLISNSAFCKFFAKFRHYDVDRYGNPLSYPAGTYYLSTDMGVEGMLSEILNAGSKDSTVKLTFPEGYTIDQIIEKLSKNSVASSGALYAAINDEALYEEYEFLKYVDNKSLRYRMLEGYMYPDTYEFYIGENANSVIKKFLNNFEDKWTELYTEKAKKLGLTIDEVITVASILEKEAFDAKQMTVIASVLYNRLDSSSFPFINCDSTGQYISNVKEKLEAEGTYVKLMKNYDTYQVTGLPVGPICNPGADAIKAALNPDKTNYYYFLHATDGKIYLARTQAEHEENMKYLED